MTRGTWRFKAYFEMVSVVGAFKIATGSLTAAFMLAKFLCDFRRAKFIKFLQASNNGMPTDGGPFYTAKFTMV